jgi:hypothetical protein
VVYNEPYISYEKTVKYRGYGAIEAAKLGAVATLIRSVTPFSIDSPVSKEDEVSIQSVIIYLCWNTAHRMATLPGERNPDTNSSHQHRSSGNVA